MRVLILGATGMLGHKLWQAYRDRYEVWGTARTISRRLRRAACSTRPG